MDPLSGVASVVAVVQISGQIIKICHGYISEVKSARADISRLVVEVQSFQEVLQSLRTKIEGPDGPKLVSTRTVVESIERSQHDLKALQAKLETKQDRRSMRRFGIRVLKWPLESHEVDRIINVLERHKSTIDLAMSTDIVTLAVAADQDQKLSKLPFVEGATFDSYEHEHEPLCLEDTRVQVLEQIRTWYSGSDKQPLFWLSGMAGTGKSTIARTVAHDLARQGKLGASFFFSRGGGDRSQARKLFSSLALQVARTSMHLKGLIAKVVAEKEDISRQFVQEQWQQLILRPVKDYDDHQWEPLNLVIVIDALDECENDSDVRTLIQLLVQVDKFQSSQIRVFLTSRPELPIRLGFKQMPQLLHQDLVLHDVPSQLVVHDIAIFLRHELGSIREVHSLPADWPAEDEIQTLLNRSEGLFIYASTVCRFIGDDLDLPLKRLESVLNDHSAEPLRQLDRMYLQVIQSSIPDRYQGQERVKRHEELKKILGLLTVSFDTLSVTSLAGLLSKDSQAILAVLRPLHSVLHVSELQDDPVRLLHPSFREFFLDPQRHLTAAVRIDTKTTHHEAFEYCFQVLPKTLRRDICEVEAPGLSRAEIPKHLVDRGIPQYVRYACTYWIYHLRMAMKGDESINPLDDGEPQEITFRGLFFYWLEVMALTGKAQVALDALIVLQATVNERIRGDTVFDLTVDVFRKFVSCYWSIITDFPFQLYSSLLTLVPLDIELGHAFQKDNPSWILSKRSALSTQTPHRALLEDDGAGRVLVTSCTGPLLASATLRGRISVWNIAAENLITAFEVIIPSKGEICFLSFSPDDKLLAITIHSPLGYVTEVWDVSGKGQANLHGHRLDGGLSVFSPKGQLIMCPIRSDTTDHLLRIIDITVAGFRMVLENPLSVSNLNPRALSRNGRWVLLSSPEKRYSLFDTTSQRLHPIGTVDMPQGEPIAVSPDGLFIVTLLPNSSRHSTSILIWVIDYIETPWQLISILQLECRHGGSFAPNMFSADSRWVTIIGSDLHSVGIFEIEKLTLNLIITDQLNSLTSAAMSLAGGIVACATADGVVRLYDASIRLLQQFQAYSEQSAWRSESPFASSSHHDTIYTTINNMYLSMDGTLLASTGQNGVLRTWEMNNGWYVSAKLDHSSYVSALTISQHKSFIATGSYMGIIEIWQSHWTLHSTIEAHSDRVTALAFSPNEEDIVSGARNGVIKIWCIATGLVSNIIECSSAIKYLALSSKGHLAIATEVAIEVRDISLDAIPCLLVKPISERLTRPRLIFSPNGRYLVARCLGSWTRLWIVSKPSTTAESEKVAATCQSQYRYKEVDTLLHGETLRHSVYATDAVGISPYDVDPKAPWVRYRGHRILWLPPEYRSPYQYEANQDSIALGNDSGNISFIRFSSELPHLVKKWYGVQTTPQNPELQAKLKELDIEE